jgi:hypothetical protein
MWPPPVTVFRGYRTFCVLLSAALHFTVQAFLIVKYLHFPVFSTVSLEVPGHRVDRVLGCRPNWDPPPPHPQASVSAPPLVPGGRAHALAGEGVGGGPIRTRGQTL